MTMPTISVKISTLRQVLLEPIILLYMLSIWMQFNLLQPLLNQKICRRLFPDNGTFCEEISNYDNNQTSSLKLIHKESAQLLFYSNLCLSIPSILLAPVLGIIGDRLGRKLPAILPAIGALLSAVNYIICAQTNAQPEILLLSNLFQGLTGGFTGCILAVSSWASVISSSKLRTSRLAFIEFANLIGTAIAPVIGGVLAKYNGYASAFGFACSLNILLILYIIFFLKSPESFSNQETPDVQRKTGRAASIWHPRSQIAFLKYLYSNGTVRLTVSVSFVCLFFTWMISTGTNEIRYNFLESLRLNWDVLKYNLFIADDALVRGLTLVTILPSLKQYFLLKDHLLMFFGLISKFAMLIFFGNSYNTVMIFIAPIMGFMAAVVSSCGRSLASKSVQNTDQGKLFALLAVLENLASLAGSGIFQNIYTATSSWFAGFSYILAGVLLLIPAAVLLILHRPLTLVESFFGQNHEVLSNIEEDDVDSIEKETNDPESQVTTSMSKHDLTL